MKNTYGYKPLSYELIELFQTGAPDFEAAEELIRRGADVNDQGDDKAENVLSTILMGYWGSDMKCVEEGNPADNRQGERWEYDLNPNLGESMIKIIQFFLDHGFDVNKDDGRFGAQCLWSLTLSTFDRYMIEATKLLLDAGAKNIPIKADPSETPMSWIGTESSYQDTCEHDHSCGNIFEATYQIYIALKEGRPYSGIDSYETAVGKRVLCVLADNDPESPVFFPLDHPQSKHNNCFCCNLYFLFEGGYLKYRKYGDCWVDNVVPEKQLTDVSDFFDPIIGQTIRDITFGHHSISKGTTDYGQPITTLHMDNGAKLTFRTNFGEVEDLESCAYYYFESK